MVWTGGCIFVRCHIFPGSCITLSSCAQVLSGRSFFWENRKSSVLGWNSGCKNVVVSDRSYYAGDKCVELYSTSSDAVWKSGFDRHLTFNGITYLLHYRLFHLRRSSSLYILSL